MCYSRRPYLKVPTTFTLDEVFCSLFEHSFPTSTSALRTLPGDQDVFLSPFSFRERTSGAFYKSIGGSYLSLLVRTVP